MNEQKIQEIAQLFIDNPTLDPHIVENGYIFGPYGQNEHYLVDEIEKIKNTLLTLITPKSLEITEELEIPQEPQQTMEEIVSQALGITLPTE